MKKIYCILIILSLIFCSGLSVYAVENNCVKKIDYFPGYIHLNGNGDAEPKYQCNIKAARDILKHCAGLTILDETQKKSADVNFDGQITVSDARALLRYIAKLDNFSITVSPGQSIKIGDFNAIYSVELNGSEELNVITRETPPEDNAPGNFGTICFYITPQKTGSYNFTLNQYNYIGKLINTSDFTVHCIA